MNIFVFVTFFIIVFYYRQEAWFRLTFAATELFLKIVNLIGIYNWFIYLVLYIFLAKEFGNQRNEKRNKKNQIEILKKVKDWIMIEEIMNEDIEKQQKVLKAQKKQ